MADLMSNALSALTSYQTALTTTSHNIANASTKGYSVQRVDFGTRTPVQTGVGSIGNGVQTLDVKRLYDQGVVEQLRTSTASYNQQNTLSTLGAQVQSLLTDNGSGLNTAMTKFFNSVQDVANAPGALAPRQVLVSDGQALASRFQDISSQLDSIDQSLNTTVSSTVSDINTLTQRIAGLNNSISNAMNQGANNTPNDLLDQRDQALLELNKLVKVSTSANTDGSLNVFIGNGQALVLSAKSQDLQVVQNQFNPRQSEIALGNMNVTDNITGGTLGGTLSFRHDVLQPARQQLGLVATSLVQVFNAQHLQGVDLAGNPGGNFFTPVVPNVQTSNANQGSAAVSLSIGNLSQLNGNDLKLRMTSGGWQLLDTVSGQPVTMTGTGTAASPFQANGLSFTVSGSAQPGDEFILQPTAQVASQMSMALTDPAKIAAGLNDGHGGAGDNRNMLALAKVDSGKVLGNGTTSIGDTLNNLIGSVASRTRLAQNSADSQNMLLQQASTQRDAVSGVNLDEEAANLMRFQQAYQAAARAVSVSNTIFQSMLSAFN